MSRRVRVIADDVQKYSKIPKISFVRSCAKLGHWQTHEGIYTTATMHESSDTVNNSDFVSSVPFCSPGGNWSLPELAYAVMWDRTRTQISGRLYLLRGSREASVSCSRPEAVLRREEGFAGRNGNAASSLVYTCG